MGKVEEYKKCNTYLQTFKDLVKLLLGLFGKHSDFILGLNILRKGSVFKASFKNFQSLVFKISKLGNFSHHLGIKYTFLHWEWGRNSAPERPQKEHFWVYTVCHSISIF